MKYDVSVCACEDYSSKKVKKALREAIAAIDGLDFVKSGMKIAIKANLMMAKKPDAAATTHPEIVAALCEELISRGANVVVGDSPGGPFAAPYLNAIYNVTGMKCVEKTGAKLNEDFTEREVEYKEAVAAKKFTATNYLMEADAIIDLCKIKTHGLMAYTGACKNMFGGIAGMIKCEYHYHYPTHELFANMLIDLYERFKPRLCIADAVICMEGNGPSAGRPKYVGAILASKNAHALDMIGAHLIGLESSDVPTLCEAMKRGLITDKLSDISVYGDVEKFVCNDFELVEKHDIKLWGGSIGGFASHFLEKIFASRPIVSKVKCVGCGECARLCPGKAITICEDENGKYADIDRSKCIACFCCQEFCPKGAISVHRPKMAVMLNKLNIGGKRKKG